MLRTQKNRAKLGGRVRPYLRDANPVSLDLQRQPDHTAEGLSRQGIVILHRVALVAADASWNLARALVPPPRPRAKCVVFSAPLQAARSDH